MNFASTDRARFLGLDVSQWPRQWRAAGALLLRAPVLRGLLPQAPVALRDDDGSTSAWLLAGGVARPMAGEAPAAAARAFRLPAGRVLERQLALPPLTGADLDQAVRLDVAAATPFGAEQTVFGHAVRSASAAVTQLDIAITSRQQIEQALRAAGFDPADPPEVWAVPAAAAPGQPIRPIVLRGFGEAQRQRQVRGGLVRRLALLGLLLALLAGLFVTPTALVRARAQQAQRAFAALQQQAAPQLVQREALMQQLLRVQAIDQLLGQQLALPPVLGLLTRTLPEGAWLTSLRVEGNKLVINGQADDAAALVQALAAEPGAHDVRLASPATRGAGAAKETFIIELYLDPRRYGPVRAAGKDAGEAAGEDAGAASEGAAS